MHLRVDGAQGWWKYSVQFGFGSEEHILHSRAAVQGQTFTQLNTTKTEILRLGDEHEEREYIILYSEGKRMYKWGSPGSGSRQSKNLLSGGKKLVISATPQQEKNNLSRGVKKKPFKQSKLLKTLANDYAIVVEIEWTGPNPTNNFFQEFGSNFWFFTRQVH